MSDPCLALVKDHFEIDNQQILQFFIRFGGLAKKTPADRVALAVSEEIVDLQERALAELGGLPAALRERAEVREATAALAAARARAGTGEAAFPRDELERLAGAARDQPALAMFADTLFR
jgi:hypothetical protein